MNPFILNQINSLPIEKEIDKVSTSIKESPYEYEDRLVPRVTSILSDMLHEEYLMNWANYMGRIKHMDHKVYSEDAADTGTITHDYIEKYVNFGIIPNFDELENFEKRRKVQNAFLSFVEWWKIINKHTYKVIFHEKSLSCKYYGGTLDMLIEIDGKIYLVDFKTSNHFNYKYHLQVAAYRRMLWLSLGILIDGAIILKLSKTKVEFEEQIIDLNTYEGLSYMMNCEQTFLSLVYAYYCRYNIEEQYKHF